MARQPSIVQGGMGVAVSNWRLARAVSRPGQLGVVSGTAIEIVCARRLQDGDAGGHLRRALQHVPIPGIAEQVLGTYYLPEGRPPGAPYRPVLRFCLDPSPAAEKLAVAAAFAEVYLAKQGHDRLVGINLLRKIEFPILAQLYGAMLAGVDHVLMGAGNPG